MIPPREQWAIQIDVTNSCHRQCSNCTRLTAHVKRPFYMTVEQFDNAASSLAEFPLRSPPNTFTPDRKVVGILGGEPLCHPRFVDLCEILERRIPRREHRGLWTGIDWQRSRYAPTIERVFGYVNNNRHDTRCYHSPILVAIQDVIQDADERARLIDDCWLQRLWSGCITPKGFFFCEVAGAMDTVFNGPGGLPVEPGCWDRPLIDFSQQIATWCPRCGIPLNLLGRPDVDNLDDVSISNYRALLDSPRIEAGAFVMHRTADGPKAQEPWRYLK